MMRKLTHKEFLEKFKNTKNNDFVVLSKYNGTKNKVQVKHIICGFVFSATPDMLYKGAICPICDNGNKTTESYKYEVNFKTNGEFTVLGNYKGNDNGVRIRHNKCGYEYSPAPNNFISGRSHCPKCSGRSPRTMKRFLKDMNKRSDVYLFDIKEFVDYDTKIKVTHAVCGYTWNCTPQNLLLMKSCPMCAGKVHDINVYKAKILNSPDGNEYKILGMHIGERKRMVLDLKHLPCGITREVVPYDFLIEGHRCPYCGKEVRKTTEMFQQEVFDLVGNEYSIIGEYKNAKAPIGVIHNKCNTSYDVSPDNFLRGRRCPVCNESHGAHKVESYLKEHGYVYEKEKTFPDLKDKALLRYDFYLPKYNLCIEYDGIQHFEPVDFGGLGEDSALKSFKDGHRRDLMKDDYCFSNSISLLRISYKDNIEKTLNSYLLNLSKDAI